MDTIPETFNSYFTKLYDKKTYLDKYGGSVIATGVTLLIFFCIFSFFYIQSKMDPIRQNWANERCKPEVMPFAGLINAPKGTSKMSYTADNFTKCTVNVLSEVVQYFTSPLYYLSDLTSNFYLIKGGIFILLIHALIDAHFLISKYEMFKNIEKQEEKKDEKK